MKKYQIEEITRNLNHAGSKATADVAKIATKLGFKQISIRMDDVEPGLKNKIIRQKTFFIDWNNAYKKIEPNSVVLIQNPFHYPQLIRNKILFNLKKKKNTKFICVVHDVEQLRGNYSRYYNKEFKTMLEISDVLIVHNVSMKKFFTDLNYSSRKIVCLDIFDYLISNYTYKEPHFEKRVTIAGNLDVKKAKYLSQLNKINCNFDLYGPNFSLEKYKNIKYHGIIPSEKLPNFLNSGFGLVWDGESIDRCSGSFGNYLKYNNPHKLSLYLASGLPVFIWDMAAEADFVYKNNVGVPISSLQDIADLLSNFSVDRYAQLSSNVKEISSNLIKGKYMNLALNEALEKIRNL